MNIFFEEWNYKTNGESPAYTVHILFTIKSTHCTTMSLCRGRRSFQQHCWLKNLLLWQDGKNPNKCHQDTTSGSKQGCKKLQQAISSLPILSLAGSNSVVPAGESVESVVWILCPVRDGACRANSGFHCHHLYPVLPLVPLPAAALAPSTPSKQPRQCCLPRRGIRTQCSASLHRRGCSDHAAFLQQPGTTRSQQGWRGGT